MANRNTQGFGLIPAGRLGGGPSIQGQGKYFIDAGHSTTIYNGETVKISSGYVFRILKANAFCSNPSIPESIRCRGCI